jgi:hypothetical protein
MPRDAVIARSDVGVIGADHPLEGDPARQTLGRVYAAAYLSLPEERRSPVSIRAQDRAGPDDLNLQHSVFRSEARARNLVDLFFRGHRSRATGPSDQPVILHHEDDLLTQDAVARYDRFSLLRRSILRSPPDSTPPMAVDPDC